MDWLTATILRLGQMGQWAAPLFAATYVGASIVLAPVFLLNLAAGAVFGIWRGTILVFISALLGASAVYALASSLARWRVLQRIDRDPRVAAVRSAVMTDALWIMFLLRLSPIVPFVLLNYALALAGVRYRDFMLASLGMLPTIVMHVYSGKVAGDAAQLAVGIAPPRGRVYYAMLAMGLVVTVVATTSITRAARRAMERQ